MSHGSGPPWARAPVNVASDMPLAATAVLMKDICHSSEGQSSRPEAERSMHREQRIDVPAEMPSLHRPDRGSLSPGLELQIQCFLGDLPAGIGDNHSDATKK
jgi:hypothetical protein